MMAFRPKELTPAAQLACAHRPRSRKTQPEGGSTGGANHRSSTRPS